MVPIASPAGLKVALSNIPSTLGSRPTLPVERYDLGQLRVGSADGYNPRQDLELATSIFYPIPDSMTLVAVTLRPGITAIVTELLGAAVASAQLQPWDRHPTPLALSYNWIATPGTVDTVLYSYIVPAGRIFRINTINLWQHRLSAASSPAYPRNYLTIAGGMYMEIYAHVNIAGALNSQSMGGGPLDVPAGTAIRAAWYNNDVGGSVYMGSFVNGYLFDA